MLFSELSLYSAVRRVHTRGTVPQPRADRWSQVPADRSTLAAAVYQAYQELNPEAAFPWTPAEVAAAWTTYGKADQAAKKIRDIALNLFERAGQRQCYYHERVPGACSAEVEVDRIKAGGPYEFRNCNLACGFHNAKRGKQRFEDFVCGL